MVQESKLRAEAIFEGQLIEQAIAKKVKEIEGQKMDDNEAGKQKEQSMTFTFKGPISWQWIQNTEKPHLSQFIVGCSRPPIFEDVNTANQPLDIDELIARHKATLDLLAKPAYPKTEPFLRAALDAEAVKKIVDKVTKRMSETVNEHKPESNLAKMNKIRTREVLKGSPGCVKYTTYTWPKSAGDRVPEAIVAELAERIEPESCIEAILRRGANICDLLKNPALNLGGVRITPTHAWARTEPAPCDKCESGVVLSITAEGTAMVRLPNGKVVDWRCDVSRGDIRAPPKPALDKEALLEEIDKQLEGLQKARDQFRDTGKITLASVCSMGSHQVGKIWERITLGEYDLPATDRPHEVGTESDPEETCPPPKPAFDKNGVSRDLEGVLRLMHLKTTDGIREDIEKVQGKIKTGKYDLPAASKPCEEGREHKCRCSTANLVEMLRTRAKAEKGIEILDLREDQSAMIKGNGSATVIRVRKEDRS